MKLQFNANRLVLLLAVTAATIGFSAFRFQDSTAQNSFRDGYSMGDEDTTTRSKRNRLKNEYNLDNLNQALKEIDIQMLALERHLESVDLSGIQREVSRELEKIDLKNLENEVQAELNKVDWKKMNEGLRKATDEIKTVNLENVKVNLEHVEKELKNHGEQLKLDGEKLKSQVEQGMQHAKDGMLKAQNEIRELNNFVEVLEKDGLIDGEKEFLVEVKEGELIINGVKQQAAVSKKYTSFYRKQNFTINNQRKGRKGVSI